MSKTVSKDGQVVFLCDYHRVDEKGHVEECRAPAKCPICKQCSRIVDNHENGHCPGHLGLNEHILSTVPNRGTI